MDSANRMRIGVLHPGEMGVSVAATLRNGGHEVYWVSEGRSAQTADRAQAQQLEDVGSLRQLTAICDVLVSVCPRMAQKHLRRRS